MRYDALERLEMVSTFPTSKIANEHTSQRQAITSHVHGADVEKLTFLSDNKALFESNNCTKNNILI